MSARIVFYANQSLSMNHPVYHLTFYRIQLPMSRSQSEKSARISYENVTRQVEPPKRQSDIVRSSRAPAYENSFHVQRPKSFDVRDLQIDPARCVGHGYMLPLSGDGGSLLFVTISQFRTCTCQLWCIHFFVTLHIPSTFRYNSFISLLYVLLLFLCICDIHHIWSDNILCCHIRNTLRFLFSGTLHLVTPAQIYNIVFLFLTVVRRRNLAGNHTPWRRLRTPAPRNLVNRTPRRH